MLIAQAQIEGLTLVSRDACFSACDVAVLPA
jgi:PIN domain nuclease of toxin-antitoxin system